MNRSQVYKHYKTYKLSGRTILHSILVNQYAVEFATRIKLKNPKLQIDLNTIDIASLYHDIAKGKGKNHDEHAEKSAAIAARLKMTKKVQDVIARHPLGTVLDNPPESLEEKIVFYADKRFDLDSKVTLKQRIKGIFKRHKYLRKKGKIRKFTKKVEEELFDLLT